MNVRVVYTAITGRHAKLSPRPRVPDTDFICYSDVPEEHEGREDWQIRPIEASADFSPRMRAKFHKMFPPRGYAWNVWIDGAYVLRADDLAQDFVDDLISQSPSGFGLHRHHERDCIFEEALHSIALKKCENQVPIIEAQMRCYAQAGHPKSWGLWGGGLMCRDNSPGVAEIMDCWWAELVRWSWRDQLSLPFVLRELGRRPDDWAWPLFQNPYVTGWEWNAEDCAVL
jgi:hypothetical protein